MRITWLLLLGTCKAKERFNITDTSHVMVFMHIQKTGGTTFNRHLINNIENRQCKLTGSLERKNKRRRDSDLKYFQSNCKRANTESTWLFSRYSVGWPCGIHADWTALHDCARSKMARLEGNRQRKYFYVTFLRDPVQRFLSEWQHVQRNATWKRHKEYGYRQMKCNHIVHQLPSCYDTQYWTKVPFDDFINCQRNLAFNRQTRMLADLKKISCYDHLKENFRNIQQPHQIGQSMLESAKHNLKELAFFGLVERQADSQNLFETKFNVKFMVDFEQKRKTVASNTLITPEQTRLIEEYNSLDMELYRYATELFNHRLNKNRK